MTSGMISQFSEMVADTPDGLEPSQAAAGSIRVDRQIPLVARNWQRIIDTSKLLPGDLVLTRSVDPDRISQNIIAAQLAGGLPDRHTKWTHAAVFLGDGEHICEANFKESGFRWGVNVRSIFDYCDGNTALRVRRPANMHIEQRIRIAIGAMTNIGKGYNFMEILDFYRIANSGRGFWRWGLRRRISPRSLVCSTLYQDAFNFSFQGSTMRMGMICTPAHLSCSTDFEKDDVEIGWLTIE
jgi:hypothetical protein